MNNIPRVELLNSKAMRYRISKERVEETAGTPEQDTFLMKIPPTHLDRVNRYVHKGER